MFQALAAQSTDDGDLLAKLIGLAPVSYAASWLLVAGFAVALVRKDSPGLDLIAGFASFVALWALVGVLLVRDRRVELER